MKNMKALYASPECEVFSVANETNFLQSNEDRDMSPITGDVDTAGDQEGGIGGNNYGL